MEIKDLKQKIKNKKIVKIGLTLFCIGLVGVTGYFLVYPKLINSPDSQEEVVNSTLAYINEVLLGGQVEAKLVGDIEKEGGLYKIQIDVAGEKILSYITKDGKLFFPEAIEIKTEEERKAEEGAKEENSALGDFIKSGKEVCLEDGKPIVYFFGSDGCPHCSWEHPIIKEVVEKFGDVISFHNNMNSGEDRDIFSLYSDGGIPTLVIGCKYYRVGSGERAGEEQEAKDLTSLICDLTNNQPEAVCLISE